MSKVFQKDTNGTLTTGLVSYWKMDGTSTDFYGSHNGTDSNISYSTTTKKIIESASFNGSTSKITFASTDTIPTAAFSMFGWIYINAFNTLGQPIFCGGSASTNNASFFRTTSTASGESSAGIAFEIWGNSAVYSNANVLTTGTWAYVGFTWDGTNITLYVNNVDVTHTRGNSNKAPIGWALNNNGGIGFAFGGSTANAHMNGYIDELCYWSKAVASQEITDLYNSGAGQTMVSAYTATASLTMMNSASRFATSSYHLAITWVRTASVSMMNAASRFATATSHEIIVWVRTASVSMMNSASRYAKAARAFIIKISNKIRWGFWTWE